MAQSQYTCPPVTATEDYRVGWLREGVREGETFLRNSTSYADMQKAKDIIAGVRQDKVAEQLSRLHVNLQKRLVRDITSTMSNLRPLWGYSTDNRDLDKPNKVLNDLMLSWYQTTFADRSIKKALQYGAVMGTGWIGPDWKADFWTRGRGDIDLVVNSPEDVLPVQMPKDNNIQRAYMATIREEVPLNLAQAMHPTLSQKIKADRSSPSGLRKGIGRMASFLSPVLNRFAADQRARKSVDTVFPVVDIHQSYILDLSVNEGPEPRIMGEPGTYWCYTVPVLGSEIVDQATGRKRRATPEDAMLYPFRRLVTWCNTGILRDDTSYWWHGKFPRVQLQLDSWPWEFIGYSMTRDLDSIEQSSNSLRRAVDDSANARLRPTLTYDDRIISQSAMESIDTRIPGKAIPIDMSQSQQPIKPLLEASYYDVPQWVLEVVAGNDELMKYLSGVNDFTAITKAQQTPSSDTIEKILEMAGPMVTDMTRNMEASLGQLGEMIKGMFFEFYTAARRLQVLGPDGITSEDVDYYEPGTLFPSHMPWEAKDVESSYSVVQRARHYMNSFYFKVTPNSLYNITQMSRKLLYIQIQKAGVPMDPWTLAEVCDIPNFGRPPEGTTSVMERWVAFERLKGELAASIQANAQQAMQQQQMQQMIAQAVAEHLTGQQGQGGPPGQPPQGGGGPPKPGGELPQKSASPALGSNDAGRPPQFGGTPTIQQKDGGTRSTITSSK